MRCFIGISLSNEALKRVKNFKLSLQKERISGNFTKDSNIHLTLLFLGEVDEEKVDLLKSALDKVDFENFDIIIKKIKNMRNLIILECEKSHELMSLQKDISQVVKSLNISIEKREYYPHITLVREANFSVEKDIFVKSEVSSIYLFSSNRINGDLIYKKEYERRSSREK